MIPTLPGYDDWKTTPPEGNEVLDVLLVHLDFDPTDDLHPFQLIFEHIEVDASEEFDPFDLHTLESYREHYEPLPDFPCDPEEALAEIRTMVDSMSSWANFDRFDHVRFTWGLA